ncbi:alpha-L-fucosidase [Kibdelosporangium banguiense]|uniref:alpha-L-fucosidase n=1 Tax=Kibdelosporangium banguiense TaxID=1365924 RepID=A0ABS4TSB2_9PSEU|nr:alpha-L-fucosidase [Kibdelosporangium banguiense]MBP2327299.1 alpha-L-fucosidase [Kibdelosporangium banguiense]
MSFGLRRAAAVLLVAGAVTVPVAASAAVPASVVAISANDSDAQILAKAGSVGPSARQKAWQQMELTAFHHFGVNTFTNREWGTGTEDPDVFNPTALDTDQWARTLRDNGFKQAILTAKHHDGFLLYPTRYSRHSVKYSSWQNGTGDVVRSFITSARKYGLKVGFYLSPADLHEAQPGGRFGNNSPSIETSIPEIGLDGTRPAGPAFKVVANDYNRFYLNTMYELLSDYGPIDEVWWDGADAVGGNKEKFTYSDWVRIVRTLQPNAVIFQDGGPDVRWVGNESGIARPGEHSVLPFQGSADGAEDRLTRPADNSAGDLGSDALLTQRDPDGTSRWDFVKWLPAECDTPLRPGWFWHADQTPKSLAQLQSIYYGSVGRNCVLLLNVAPDNTGRLPDADVTRLAEFTQWRSKVFTRDLARGARTTWQAGPSNTGTLTVDLRSPKKVNVLGLQENIDLGQRITSFAVDAWDGTAWRTVASETTIGYKRLLPLKNSVTTQKLRVRVTGARAQPVIATFSAYDDGRATNLALNQPATQSSTHTTGAAASRAVDGNTDGNFANGSVTHTTDSAPDPLPWWQVDLGSAKQIGTINIHNRTDCCAQRLSDYWVFVSENPFDTTKTPQEQARTPGVWSSHQTTRAGNPTQIPVGAPGRHVMVRQTGPTVLSLAEIEVLSQVP